MDRVIQKELREKKGKVFFKYFIKQDEVILGSAILRDRKGEMTILSLQVEPEFRGKGVATELLNKIISDYSTTDLYIRPRPYKDKPVDRDKLRNFYAKMGFVELGEEGKMVKLHRAGS